MDAPFASRPHRLEPRYPFACDLELRGQGVRATFRTGDVSRGGVFLTGGVPLELFAEVVVVLPGGVATPARVMHVVSEERALAHSIEPGMGLQFEPLEPEQHDAIARLLERARRSDVRPRVPQRRPSGDLLRAQADPILEYVLEGIDGEGGPEELAERLGLPLGSIEDALAELSGLGLIELRPRAVSVAPSPTAKSVPEPASSSSARLRKVGGIAPHLRVELIELWSKLGQLDHYQVLGIDRAAGRDEIRHAFFELSKRFHPDAHYGRELGADLAKLERVFARLSEAYGVLGRAASRAEYDRYLERKRALTLPPPPQPSAASEPGERAALLANPQPRPAGGPAARDLWVTLQGQAARRELVAALRAQAAYEEKHQRWGDAAETWQRVCRDEPRDAAAHRHAAKALQHARRGSVLALQLAKRAVELEPNDAQNRRVLGQLYLAAGLKKKARAELEAALALRPTTPTIPARGRAHSS